MVWNADAGKRSTFIPLLIVGAVLIGFSMFLAIAPLFTCRPCRGTGVQQFWGSSSSQPHGCPFCEAGGKVPLLKHWMGREPSGP